MDYRDFLDRPMACHPDRLALTVACLHAGYGSRSSVENDSGDCEIVQNSIAVIPVCGLLRRGGFAASYSAVRQSIARAMADPKIGGLVLSIDSMGGECTDLFSCSDYLYSQRGAKPIYAIADSAYAGAYVIASAADKVYVPRAAHVGSIGIAFAHVDVSAAMEKQGLRVTLIFAGQKKILGNTFEPLAQDAKDELQQECDRLSGMLVKTAARNRGVSAQRIAATQAGCYMGEAGVPLLADCVGSLNDALSDMMDELGIEGTGQYSRLQRAKGQILRLQASGSVESDIGRRKRLIRELEGR